MHNAPPITLLNPTTTPRFSPRPQQIGIEVTGRCQLRCQHCFNQSGPDQKQELPLPVIERALDEIASWGVVRVRITGGEPTFHQDFVSVLAACEARRLRVVLNSHGVYTRKLLAWLLNAPIERFIISLDGLAPNHEAIRGRGAFDRAVASCRKLCAAGKAVTVAFHAAQYNWRDTAGLVNLVADIGADLKISPVRPLGRLCQHWPEALLTPADYLGLVREVRRLRQRYPKIHIYTDFDLLDKNADSCAVTDAKVACGAGRTMLSVAYTGDIYPCAFFTTRDRTFSAGNIYRDSLAEVWEHSPVFKPFRIHTKSGTCQQCGFYRRSCAGGCPAVAFFSQGALDAHDPMCFAALLDMPGVAAS